MLIHFETRSRWGITISSPHHGAADQTALPGARPFVSDSGDHSRFSSTNPPPQQYPKHTFEDTCPLQNGKQSQRRRNGFWKLCRLLIRIRKMHPHRFPHIAQEPLVPGAPGSDISYMEHMSDSPIAAELPSTLEIAELESPEQKSFSPPYIAGQMWGGYPYHENFMSLGCTIQRALEHTDTTMSPLTSNSQQPFDSVPGLISEHQSHISSPVSSVTPDTNILRGAQFESHRDFQQELEASINDHPPPQYSWDERNGMNIEQNNTWRGDRVSPIHTAETSFASAGGSSSSHPVFRRDSHMEYTSLAHSNGVSTCDAGSTASPSMQNSDITALPQSHGAMSIPLGLYERDSNNVWLHYPPDGLERHNAKTDNRSTMRASPSQSPSHVGQFDGRQQPTYAEYHDHTYPEVVEEIQCSECDKIFRGRYRDTNMRRHVRVVHKGTAKKQCSFCGRWFRRSDALRKHERDKHR